MSETFTEVITAAEARATMYNGAVDLYETILLAAYLQIRSSAICAAQSVCDDYENCAPDDVPAVCRAVKRVASTLRKQGYACTVFKTSLDIEWGE